MALTIEKIVQVQEQAPVQAQKPAVAVAMKQDASRHTRGPAAKMGRHADPRHEADEDVQQNHIEQTA